MLEYGAAGSQPSVPEGDAVASASEAAGPEAAGHRRLFNTFAYLVVTQGATALLGFAYWPLVTHLFTPRVVGIAAAATSTGTFLAFAGGLGVATLLLAEARSIHPRLRRMTLTTGLVAGSVTVVLLSAATLGLSPLLGKSLSALGRQPVVALLFVVGAGATVAAASLDSVSIALRRGHVQLVRGVLASVLKIALVALFVAAGAHTTTGLVFAWSIGLVVSLPISFFLLRLDKTPAQDRGLRSRLALARGYGSRSINHHLLNLSINSISYVRPFLAALLVLPGEVAYFSTAQVLASVLSIVPFMLAYALFAETANDEQLLRRLIRRTLPLSFFSCVLITLAAEVVAPFALELFGAPYRAHATTPLRLLVLGAIPYVVKDHYVAIRRTQARLAEGARILLAWTSLETAAAAVGGVLFGLDGLCAGWVMGATVEGIALAPAVIRLYRRSAPAAPAAPV